MEIEKARAYIENLAKLIASEPDEQARKCFMDEMEADPEYQEAKEALRPKKQEDLEPELEQFPILSMSELVAVLAGEQVQSSVVGTTHYGAEIVEFHSKNGRNLIVPIRASSFAEDLRDAQMATVERTLQVGTDGTGHFPIIL